MMANKNLKCHTKKLEDIYLVNKVKKTIMRIKKNFVLRDVVGKKAIFCVGIKAIDFRKIITLNESGEWVWQEAQAQGDFTAESLTVRVCEEYDVTAEVAQSYVTDFLEQLDKEGMIEK